MYTKNDYEKFKRITNAHQILNMNFDDLVYVTLGYDFYDNILPPHTKMLNSVWYRGLDFPDCGETSLLNLINALIYEQANGTFNMDRLKQLGAVPTVINFYCTFKTPTALSIDEQKTHNEWAKVVSGLTGVKYGKAGLCDIEPGIDNMMNVIKNLLPGIDSFATFIAKLKELGIEIQLTSTAPLSHNTDNVVTLKVNTNRNQFDLVWQFQSGHFELKYPKKDEIDYAKTYCKALLKRAQLSKSDAYCLAHLGIAPAQLSFVPAFASSHAYMYLVSQYDNKQKIEAASHLVESTSGNKDRRFTQPYVLALSEKLSRNEFEIDKFLEAISSSNTDLEEIVTRAQKDSSGRASAIIRIIKNKKTNLYKWAGSHEILKVITGDDAVALAITILQQPKAPNETTAAFMKSLYSWIPNFSRANTENMPRLILALFDAPENSSNDRVQFANQLFELEIPENILTNVSNSYASTLLMTMLKHPMTEQQERSKLGQLLTKSAQSLLKKTDLTVQFIITLLLEEAHIKQPVFSHFQELLHKELLILSPDLHKKLTNVPNGPAIIGYLLQNPMSAALETSELGKSIIETIPSWMSGSYESAP